MNKLIRFQVPCETLSKDMHRLFKLTDLNEIKSAFCLNIGKHNPTYPLVAYPIRYLLPVTVKVIVSRYPECRAIVGRYPTATFDRKICQRYVIIV